MLKKINASMKKKISDHRAQRSYAAVQSIKDPRVQQDAVHIHRQFN